jgi:hypothetical protein
MRRREFITSSSSSSHSHRLQQVVPLNTHKLSRRRQDKKGGERPETTEPPLLVIAEAPLRRELDSWKSSSQPIRARLVLDGRSGCDSLTWCNNGGVVTDTELRQIHQGSSPSRLL